MENIIYGWKRDFLSGKRNRKTNREVTHHWRQAITPDETLRAAGPGLGEDDAPDASASPGGAAGLGGSSTKGEASGG